MIRSLVPVTPRGKIALAACVLGVLGIAYVGATMFAGPGKTPTPGSLLSTEPRDRESGFDVAVPSARRVAGFVESYAPRVEETERDVRKLEDELKAAGKREQEREALLRRLLERLDERENKEAAERDSAGLPARAGPVGANKLFTGSALLGATEARAGDRPPEPELPARIQKIALPPPTGSPRKEVQLPAGSFAEGILLTGVFAPVEGQALPVQIRLASGWTTPNRGRVELGDAFLVGKAQGDANSERAVVQLEKLSYVHAGGRAMEVAINGFIVDADGVQGAAGKYVWRASELLFYSGLAGAAAGSGDALSQGQTATQLGPLGGATQILTGDLGKFAGGRALSGASAQLKESVAKRLGEITPAVWIPNGRRVTVILIDGATLPNLGPKEIDHEERRLPFSGLDLDR